MSLSENSQSSEASPLDSIEPTSTKELWAWWIYNFAYEPISIVAFQLFVPLLLTSFARANGLDPATGAGCTELSERCVLFRVGSLEITSSSFAYYTIAISVLMQAVTFVSVGALADYGPYRKRLLIASSLAGSLASMAVLAVQSTKLYMLVAILVILMNVFFGTATVFYNAYLPILSSGHVRRMEEEAKSKAEDPISNLDRTANWISTRGFIIGYVGALLTLILTGLAVWWWENSLLSKQAAVAFCGLWWLLFGIWPLWQLKTRPGPALPSVNYIIFSWSKVLGTLRRCKQLPVTFWFLLAYFLYSDGYSTLGSVAVLFARDVLHVPDDKLILAVILAPLASLVGNFICYHFQRLTKATSKAMVVGLLLLLSLIPVWGALGLWTRAVGLHNLWEIYLFAGWFGFAIGAIQSYSRVMFAELIPRGLESEFFSLYAITDKGSSWIGPLFQTLISDWTRNPRLGLLFLLVLLVVPIPILLGLVDMEAGRTVAAAYRIAEPLMTERSS